nr:hypothetical protein [Tanacetum cinerariifolium]
MLMLQRRLVVDVDLGQLLLDTLLDFLAKREIACAASSQTGTVIMVVHRELPDDLPEESFETREYPSLIQTYFDTHSVDGVFLQDEERLLYEEMLRLKDLGPNTSLGVPYTKDEIMAMVHQGKQRVRSDDKMSQLLTQLKSHHGVGSGSGSGGDGDDEPGEDEDADPYINIC